MITRIAQLVLCWMVLTTAGPSEAADVSAPSRPIVTDDGAYTSSASTLRAMWVSTDPQSGIAEYQYQIRRDSSSGAIVVDWTSVGAMRGVTRPGLFLTSGKKYVFGVKARNGSGLWSPVGFSNGILVDTSGPTPPGQPTAGPSGPFVYDLDGRYQVSWSAALDAESSIDVYELQERTGPAASWVTLSAVLTGRSFTVSNRQHGGYYRYQVRARNRAGLWGPFSPISHPVAVDKTPPFPPQVLDGAAYTSSTTTLQATWSASDPESPVVEYQYEVRRDSPTGSAIVGWTRAGTTLGVTRTGLTLLHGVTYYVNVKARNAVGLWSAIGSSNGVQVDATPPSVPVVTDDGATTDSLTTLHAQWSASSDPESWVFGYQVAIGTTAGGSEIRGWTDVGGARETTQANLALVAGTTYYVSVRAWNGAGAFSAVGASDGIRVNVPPPPAPSLVRTSGRQLLVRRRLPDGTLGPEAPYVIRGVCWSPASRNTATTAADPNNAAVRRLEFGAWYGVDIPLMKAMRVNTVRLFLDPGVDPALTPVGRSVLDELYRNDIMVIMTVDNAVNDVVRAQQVVNLYKNHPAILMWSLGNEWNINRYYGVAASVLDAAQRTEGAAQLLKSLDVNHPVASSYGEIDIDAAGLRLADTASYVGTIAPSVDVWSLNIYRPWTFGPLWAEWAAISGKPMFIGEFGIDAFRATNPDNPVSGVLDETEQAEWVVHLWDDIVRNLSAADASKTTLGGTVFEWADEWWKVQPWGSQQTGGWFSDGFPDGMGNEEFFGIVDIDRMPRQVYAALAEAFDPAYVPPPRVLELKAQSSGGSGGIARFLHDRRVMYKRGGGGGGGRGFNVAVINPATGDIVDAGQNFDTWATGSTAMTALLTYLAAIPDGQIVLLAVGDEAGLTYSTTCTPLPYAESAFQALEALGSTQIRSYCFRGAWAMIAVKGTGVAEDEAIGPYSGGLVEAATGVELP